MPGTVRTIRLFTLILLASFGVRADNCAGTLQAKAGDTLTAFAVQYLGDADYAPAILLATNATYQFIPNPDNLSAGAKICIPDRSVASALRAQYEPYLRAIAVAAEPHPRDVNAGVLQKVPAGPATVVSWTRDARAKQLGAPGKGPLPAPFEIWVTLVPHLHDFCSAYVQDHGYDEAALTRRLEQRLGLPPGAGDTVFVELKVQDPSTGLFRPCADPAVNVADCPAAPPAPASKDYQEWFFTQYYNSYATALPWQYPWTALGYTFDWATDDKGTLARYGESEFVIHKGAAIEVLADKPLSSYCQPGQ